MRIWRGVASMSVLALLCALQPSSAVLSRQQVLKRALVGVQGALLAESVPRALLADDRLWISGKNPEKNKDPSDKRGTRKETGFLRCLSQCKSECESAGAGAARGRGECLQACQDECCQSYEQCTYTLRE
eukprot:scaffold7052_cov254-Pinguiococcus_pyrenoidosus.AAC.113